MLMPCVGFFYITKGTIFMSSRRQLTPEGFEKLQREISRLREVDIPRAVERLKEVREDSVGNEEDPELNDAMENKKRLEERLDTLMDVMNNADIIEDNDPHVINIGDRVVLLDIEYNEEMILDVVDGVEISADRRAITADSPVGRAIMGKKVGDVIKVKVPDGEAKYKVLSFEPIA
jgi:transcription elongation factor GreA